jgi:hypothetical protein
MVAGKMIMVYNYFIMDHLDIIKEIYNSGNLLPTELYNEGWMLRLVLYWFNGTHKYSHEKITMKEGIHWFSEGRLESPFKKNEELTIPKEGYTRADGAYGNIELGNRGDSDIKLKEDCRQFVVTEAKMFSKYSEGIKRKKNYNQAARNIACMYQVVENYKENYGKSYHDIEEIAFYTLLPESQIEKEVSFKKYTTVKHIKETIENRIEPYNGKMKEWFNSFNEFLEKKIKIDLISWEEIVIFIKSNDPEYGKMLSDFYDKCLEFNKRRINKKDKMTNEKYDKGVSLIYCPEINKTSFVHFSWKGNSARIRDYTSEYDMSICNKYSTEEIRNKIDNNKEVKEKHYSFKGRKPVGDINWWYKEIKKINQENKL